MKQIAHQKILLSLILFLGLAPTAWCAEEPKADVENVSANISARLEKRFGLTGGIKIKELDSDINGGISYNINSFFRVTAKYGQKYYSHISADVKYLFFESNVSPFLIAGFDWKSGTYAELIGVSGLTPIYRNISVSEFGIMYGAGVDWQSDLGFCLGTDFKFVGSKPAIDLYLGWFFKI